MVVAIESNELGIGGRLQDPDWEKHFKEEFMGGPT
jgi:hypothetical protein